MSSVNPLFQLIVCNIKVYMREPEAIFWTYGFPLLMVIGLGVAFDTSAQQPVKFDAVEGKAAQGILASLGSSSDFVVTVKPEEEALIRLRRNKTPLVVSWKDSGGYEYHYDPSNPEAKSTRLTVDDALQRSAGRRDSVKVSDVRMTAPGSRYVDFLVPGLIGMNLMGGGMWGIGFVLVDMRLKKLLKRLPWNADETTTVSPLHRGNTGHLFPPGGILFAGFRPLPFRCPNRRKLSFNCCCGFSGSHVFCRTGSFGGLKSTAHRNHLWNHECDHAAHVALFGDFLLRREISELRAAVCSGTASHPAAWCPEGRHPGGPILAFSDLSARLSPALGHSDFHPGLETFPVDLALTSTATATRKVVVEVVVVVVCR